MSRTPVYRRLATTMRRVADEVVLVPHGRSSHPPRMVCLDEVATVVWSALEGEAGFDELLSAVLSRFDVDEPTARADLAELLCSLRSVGVVECLGAEAPDAPSETSVAHDAVAHDEAYAAFSARIHAKVLGTRLPVQGALELTHRCNLTCVHCYDNLPMGDARARREEMSLDEIRRVLRELADAGCLWLLLTGGEATARRDFGEILEVASSLGFLVTVFTNATMISDRVLEALVRHRPFSIEVTLYGARRETYERVTGVPGSFERCIAGIERLLAAGLPLKLKSVAMGTNAPELADMRTLAARYGIELKWDGQLMPRIDGGPKRMGPLAVRLPPAEVVALDLQDPERVAAFRRLLDRPRSPPPAGDPLYRCGAGKNAFNVDPFGRLTGCVAGRRHGFDLRSGSFAEGWEFLRSEVERSRARPSKCSACGLRAMCGSCPAHAELEHGDPEASVEHLCELAHLRALVFGIDVPDHGGCAYCHEGDARQRLLERAAELRPGGLAASPRSDVAASSPAPRVRRLPLWGQPHV